MAYQEISIGTVPNDGTGDSARTSFTKSNSNDIELYQEGIPYWDTNLSYAISAYTKGSNGVIYRALIATNSGTAVNPVGDTSGTWEVAFIDVRYSGYENLLDNAFLEVQERYNGSITADGYLTDQVYALCGSATADIDSVDVPSGADYSVHVTGRTSFPSGVRLPRPIIKSGIMPKGLRIGDTVTVQAWVKTTDSNVTFEINSRDSVGGLNSTTLTGVATVPAPSTGWNLLTATLTFTSAPAASNTTYFLNIETASNNTAIRVTQWDLKPIPFATPIVNKGYGKELAECQRFFYKQLSQTASDRLANGLATSATTSIFPVSLPVPMWGNPSAIVATLSGVTDWTVADGGATSRGSNLSVALARMTSSNVVSLNISNGGGSLITTNPVQLRSNVIGAYIEFNNSL
jgi:hypothetical protein